MAINDWLAPQAPLQPTYLTSRAMGAVVPEYFQQAADVAKTRLGLLGQEQNLRLADEQAARAREEDARMRASREAAASLLPQLSQLDPTSPDYYKNLYDTLQTPGAANALTDRSMSEFLGIQQRARGEQIDQSRLQQQLKQQAKQQKEMIEREERAAARSSAAGLSNYIEAFARELDQPEFALKYRSQLKEFDKMDEGARDTFMDNLNLDYSQARMKKELAGTGLKLDSDKAKELMVDDGTGKKVFSRDKVDSYLGEVRNRARDTELKLRILAAQGKDVFGLNAEELDNLYKQTFPDRESPTPGVAKDLLGGGAGGNGKRSDVER